MDTTTGNGWHVNHTVAGLCAGVSVLIILILILRVAQIGAHQPVVTAGHKPEISKYNRFSKAVAGC
jgi:hypothetical protein